MSQSGDPDRKGSLRTDERQPFAEGAHCSLHSLDSLERLLQRFAQECRSHLILGSRSLPPMLPGLKETSGTFFPKSGRANSWD